MKFVHRFSHRANATQRRELEALGVKLPAGIVLPGGGEPYLVFDVDEKHSNWLRVSLLLQEWRALNVVRTEFTKKELDSARWLAIGAWPHGYPQPNEGEFGYRQATYDLADWCQECGIGKKQKGAFQMKREPKWGRNALMQLIWVYDELFVTPEVWAQVFKPAGVACRPVLNTKGVELKSVVQLVVEETVGISTDRLESERCPRCQRVKYRHVTRGPFPVLLDVPVASMARTAEYFGSGGQADQRLLVSGEIARALAAANIRGASLTPVAECA